MDIEATLYEIGLNKSEIAIYLYLIKYGRSTVQNVSRETFISRTNCYYVLRSLIKRGLIMKVIIDNKTGFEAKDPSALEEMLLRKEELALSITPHLKQLGHSASNVSSLVTHKSQAEITGFLSLVPLTSNLLLIGPKPSEGSLVYNLYSMITKPEINAYSARFIEKNESGQYFIVFGDTLAIFTEKPVENLVEIKNADLCSIMREVSQ